jgi:NTP pyrophosphatase (non-canonical NTP hydrolase)
MNLTQYAVETARTAGATRAMTAEESALLCMALGLAGEAGEFADKVKKMLYHDHPVSMAEFTKELGDVMWYWTQALPALNVLFEQRITHEVILDQNIGKLRTRYPDGFTPEASLARVDASSSEPETCDSCSSEACLEWCEQDGSECAA